MHKVVLLRHGESTWNKENRFTGWTDVDLTETGREEAARAAQLLKQDGFIFDVAYTSVLKRAIRTLWIVLDGIDLMWLPVHRHWRLNERHYGALQGLNKAETAAKHGEAQMKLWRRSYDIPPPRAHAGRRAVPGTRPAIRAADAGRTAAHRVPEGHGQPLPPLLARDDRARRAARRARPDHRARQQPAGAGQVPRQHLRRGDRRAEHPDGHSSGLRAGSRPAADPQQLPGRSGSGEESGGEGGGADERVDGTMAVGGRRWAERDARKAVGSSRNAERAATPPAYISPPPTAGRREYLVHFLRRSIRRDPEGSKKPPIVRGDVERPLRGQQAGGGGHLRHRVRLFPSLASRLMNPTTASRETRISYPAARARARHASTWGFSATAAAIASASSRANRLTSSICVSPCRRRMCRGRSPSRTRPAGEAARQGGSRP